MKKKSEKDRIISNEPKIQNQNQISGKRHCYSKESAISFSNTILKLAPDPILF